MGFPLSPADKDIERVGDNSFIFELARSIWHKIGGSLHKEFAFTLTGKGTFCLASNIEPTGIYSLVIYIKDPNSDNYQEITLEVHSNIDSVKTNVARVGGKGNYFPVETIFTTNLDNTEGVFIEADFGADTVDVIIQAFVEGLETGLAMNIVPQHKTLTQAEVDQQIGGTTHHDRVHVGVLYERPWNNMWGIVAEQELKGQVSLDSVISGVIRLPYNFIPGRRYRIECIIKWEGLHTTRSGLVRLILSSAYAGQEQDMITEEFFIPDSAVNTRDALIADGRMEFHIEDVHPMITDGEARMQYMITGQGTISDNLILLQLYDMGPIS